MTRKDALSLAISIFALVLSSVTAYFNLFRVAHDASVVIGEDYGVFTNFEERGLTSFSTDGDLVFVNNGTHPLAILGLQLQLYQLDKVDGKREDCRFSKDAVLDWTAVRPNEGFDRQVIPAKGIAIIRPTFGLNPAAQSARIVRQGENPLHIFTAQGQEETPTFVTCLRVDFVPAGGKVESVERHLFHTIGEGTSPGPFHEGNPIQLIKRTELPF